MVVGQGNHFDDVYFSLGRRSSSKKIWRSKRHIGGVLVEKDFTDLPANMKEKSKSRGSRIVKVEEDDDYVRPLGF